MGFARMVAIGRNRRMPVSFSYASLALALAFINDGKITAVDCRHPATVPRWDGILMRERNVRYRVVLC